MIADLLFFYLVCHMDDRARRVWGGPAWTGSDRDPVFDPRLAWEWRPTS